MSNELAEPKWLRALIQHAINRDNENYESSPATEMLKYLISDILTEDQLKEFSECYFPLSEIEEAKGEEDGTP